MTSDLQSRMRAMDWACARAEAAVMRWEAACERAAGLLSEVAQVA